MVAFHSDRKAVSKLFSSMMAMLQTNNPQLPMTPYQQVTAKLQALGWDWSHPRLQSYIQDLAVKYNKKYSPGNLPLKKMQRILEFLEIYDNCNKILQDTGISWRDEMVTSYFQQVSTKNKDGSLTNRLLMKDWINFRTYISKTYIPF